MNFTIEKEVFLKGLARVQGIVEKRNTIPVLSNVLLEGSDGELRLTATDLEVGMQSTYPANIRKPGKITVSAKKLYEIIKELPDNEISFNAKDNCWIEVECGKAQFNIVGLSADEFPNFPKPDQGHSLSLASALCKEMIEKTFFAVSQDESKYNLNGIFCQVQENTDQLRFVATDGHRLSMIDKKIANSASSELSKGVILPRKGILELKKLAEEGEGDLKLGFMDNNAVISKDRSVIIMRLVDGEFPDYSRVIPKANEQEAAIAVDPFLHALRRMIILSSEKSRGVKMNFKKNLLEVSSSNPELGDAREELDIEYQGTDLSVGFNARYLLDILQVQNQDKIRMILNNLKLRCYRNLTEAELTWNEHFNVIYGQNAQGKTNLLEAIYLLGHLKSFRGARGQELINHTAETAWVGATVLQGGVQHRLDIGLQKNGRNPRIDGKTVQKLSQFLGYFRTVLFTPEELSNVKGFPAGRRALLDRAILQTEPTYLDRVQEYDRILRQRNQLLKQQSDASSLAPWTEALVRTGSRIRYDRQTYLERFLPRLCQVYREITGHSESAGLNYSIEQMPLSALSDHMKDAFERLGTREKKLGLTLAGPHRDDLDFLVEGRSLRSFGSQGQQRSFLLAFKAAQVMDLEEQFREPPVLLLDDLASELDSSRQEGFFNFLLNRRGQVFLTSAQQPLLADQVKQTASFYKVDQGMVNATSPERG